ncbi:MAG: hypothetical protein B6244_10965 [Candidatus Cloacimonetes bacterium 4572_55]|nr:MAG: hypothetical protein B6244_10965 [Candidatus Cloacimonetes bacterium 4572_55]
MTESQTVKNHPPTDRLKENLWRYNFFAAMTFTPIMLPVIVLFWQENGLEMFDIFLLQSVFAVAVVLLEVPTGMVADRLGKRVSLIASSAFLLTGMTTYALGFGFWIFLIAELLLSFGISLLSGADSAFLYDTLKRLDRTDEYQRIEGRARSIQLASVALCNLIGGFVGAYSYRMTLWLSAIGPFIALFTAFGFIEVNRPNTPRAFREGIASYSDLFGQSFHFVRKHRLIRWYILFSAVLTGSATWLLWLYQPYMRHCGLPIPMLGVAFTIFNLFAALVSRYAYRISDFFGQKKMVFVLMALQIFPLPALSFFIYPFSFLFILGHQAVRGILSPVMKSWILRYTYADKRATVLSMNSMGGRLFFAITALVVGFVTDRAGISQTILFQMALLIVFFGALIIAYHRIPEKYFHVKSMVQDNQ